MEKDLEVENYKEEWRNTSYTKKTGPICDKITFCSVTTIASYIENFSSKEE